MGQGWTKTPRGTANWLPAAGVSAVSVTLGAAALGLFLGQGTAVEPAGPVGQVLGRLQGAGVGWAPLAAAALAGVGVAFCLRGLATLERRMRAYFANQPDPTLLLEEIDLSQQNLHLGIAGIEKSVQRGVNALLDPLRAQVEELGEVAGGLRERAEQGDHVLETRIANIQMSLTGALTELRGELQTSGQAQRDELRQTLEARMGDLEQRVATRVDGSREELVRCLQQELAVVREHLSREVAERLATSVPARQPAPEPPMRGPQEPLAESRPLSGIEQVNATLESAYHAPAIEPDPPAEPVSLEPASLEPEPEPTEESLAGHQPMLEPEVARALAETGFHRVSSLGLFDSLDEQGEVSTTETRSGIEIQEGTPHMDVDELPPLRGSVESPPASSLRLQEDAA